MLLFVLISYLGYYKQREFHVKFVIKCVYGNVLPAGNIFALMSISSSYARQDKNRERYNHVSNKTAK